MATRTSSSGTSAARDRLLATASELFYREGIHSVGVDRIVGEAGVTRATFYRHFPSKEDLVEAYLGVEDANIRAAFDAAEETGAEPRELVGLVIDGLADDVARHHTRGCPFINAAAEYPDADSGVRRAVAAHREWFRSELEHVLEAADAADPRLGAAELVLVRDAAMVGGYLDGWERVRPAFVASARRAAGLPESGVE
ncbi:TetR/AcrR family transcriptional regulator [Agromyces bracchium]|uniref:TetR family transcriptional regulator n=1 Tax=Agromyces bracchium TaxID=88376 RepID=A0A6I3MAV2_9MICO|nr:TetR/AcrR family transcriptional regulator [Agromyces bracchium]MTH69898.1 TetR family transcriptional regulator [Agromyces bracchium]